MSWPVVHESVAQADALLLPYAAEHRVTVVCGLVAPATGEIALVSARADDTEMGLALPQGDIVPGKSLARAYLRTLREDLDVWYAHIADIHAVPLEPPVADNRPHDSQPNEAYGLVYGMTRNRPELHIRGSGKIAVAEWRTLSGAGTTFRMQQRTPGFEAHGTHNLDMLYALSNHFVETQGPQPLQG